MAHIKRKRSLESLLVKLRPGLNGLVCSRCCRRCFGQSLIEEIGYVFFGQSGGPAEGLSVLEDDPHRALPALTVFRKPLLDFAVLPERTEANLDLLAVLLRYVERDVDGLDVRNAEDSTDEHQPRVFR